MGILTDKLKCRLGEPFHVKGNVEKGLATKFKYELIIGSSEGETVIMGDKKGEDFDGNGIEITLGEEFVAHAYPYGDGRMCYIKATGRRKPLFKDEETVEYITYINLFGDLMPTFTLTVEVDNGNTDFKTDKAIKGFSKVTAKVSGIGAKFGATVAEVEFTGGVFSRKFNVTQPEFDPGAEKHTITLDPIENSGEIFVFASVLTSHGYRSSQTYSFNVLDYTPPTLKVESAKRYYKDGEEKKYIENSSDADKIGRYPIEIRGEIVPCTMQADGKQLCVIEEIAETALIRRVNDAEGAEIELETHGNSFSFDGTPYFREGDEGTEIFCAYELAINCRDSSKREYTLIYRIRTLGTAFHLKKGGNGAKFGGYASKDDQLESDWDILGNKNITAAGTVEGETLKGKTLIFVDADGKGTEFKGAGNTDNTLARGDHMHGYIGTDGCLYDTNREPQKKKILITDDTGKIIGVYPLTSEHLLMATDDSVMQKADVVGSVGSADKGFCYANHVHPYSDAWKNDQAYTDLVDKLEALKVLAAGL